MGIATLNPSYGLTNSFQGKVLAADHTDLTTNQPFVQAAMRWWQHLSLVILIEGGNSVKHKVF
jgi:hypothetical protein